jgi:hypothetical protein
MVISYTKSRCLQKHIFAVWCDYKVVLVDWSFALCNIGISFLNEILNLISFFSLCLGIR